MNMKNEMESKPTRCVDPIMKYCQECPWGWVEYPEWAETAEDLTDCTFESGCTLGLENDEPTEQEMSEFEQWHKKNMPDNLAEKKEKI